MCKQHRCDKAEKDGKFNFPSFLQHEERMRLEEAYRRTSFIVRSESDSIVRRVGNPAPEMDVILNEKSVEEWAFVTACNPRSMNLPEEENRARQESLEKLVSQRGYAVMRGEGVGDGGDWLPEPSLLILGISKKAAIELGRLFGQNAVVAGRVGQAVELLWCLKD